MPEAKNAPQIVTDVVTVDLISAEDSVEVTAQLLYTSADPYAMSMTFLVEDVDVTWTFGRDLLLDGLNEPTGDGDVHFRPCIDADGRAVVLVELYSGDQAALIQARACDLRRFADATTGVVPSGRESVYLDVEAAVTALLVADSID
jgi:hypothetical protein